MSTTKITYDFGEFMNFQIKIIDKMNSGKRVYLKTLIDNGLDCLDVPEYQHMIIKPKIKKQKSKQKIKPAIHIEEIEIAEAVIPKVEFVRKVNFTKDDIVEHINTYYENEKTKRTYLNGYKDLPHFISDQLEYDDFWEQFIQNPKIKSILSPMSTYISCNFPIQYAELKKKITLKIKNQIQDEKLKALEKKDDVLKVTADEMLAKYNKYLETKTLGIPNKYFEDLDGIMLGLYCTLPLRDDFHSVSFVERLSEGFNFLNLEKSEITILPKKGAKEQKTFTVPEPLMNLITDSLKKYPREFLFTKPDGSALGSANKNVTRSMKRIFKIDGITICGIRSAFTTKANNSSIQDMIDMAQLQSHTLETSLIYYSKKES